MTRIGYFLSSEEHPGSELVKAAALAERSGFEALWISDHFHPWLDDQGHSPFVWSVLGAIAAVTEQVKVTTETQFAGLDAYKKVIDSGVDVVLLTTPPAFRWLHFKYAVEKNKPLTEAVK